jgi:hypothetical protein
MNFFYNSCTSKIQVKETFFREIFRLVAQGDIVLHNRVHCVIFFLAFVMWSVIFLQLLFSLGCLKKCRISMLTRSLAGIYTHINFCPFPDMENSTTFHIFTTFNILQVLYNSYRMCNNNKSNVNTPWKNTFYAPVAYILYLRNSRVFSKSPSIYCWITDPVCTVPISQISFCGVLYMAGCYIFITSR